MLNNFPSEYTACLDWQWSDWQPHFQTLLDTELTTGTIEDWMANWKRLHQMAYEIESRLNFAVDIDTTNEQAEAKFKQFIADVKPELSKVTNELNKKLVASGLAPDEIRVPLRQIENRIKNFREENLVLETKERGLEMEYMRVIGDQTVQWDGKETTIDNLQSVFHEADRERREKAWLLMQERFVQSKESLDNLWKQFMDTRLEMANNAGFADFRAYMWENRGRFDYNPDDALAFCNAIAEVVSPVAERLRNTARDQLQYDRIRPWDCKQHSFDVIAPLPGKKPLKPYTEIEDLIDKGANIFTQLDPELGDQFRSMHEANFLDLDNRKGKAPGGYCNVFPVSESPIIFMNATGLARDVTTLLHEAGHCFHVFSMLPQRYHVNSDFNYGSIEFAEVGSMAMELLATPYLTEDHGGYFTPQEAIQYRADHLRGIVYALCYIALTVEFQHWIYTHHKQATDTANCDAKYTELWFKYIRGIEWDGVEQFIPNRWRQQRHIYNYPFYYIEYALAQLGAIQVWENSLQNEKNALQQYRHALTLGNSVTLPELFEAAGAKLAFDKETIARLITLVENTIEEL